MKKRLGAILMVLLAIAGLLGSGYSLGYEAGRKTPQVLTVEGISNVENQEGVANFNLFWDAWRLLQNEYLRDSEVTPQNKLYGAISGLVRSLDDPYTEFFIPEDNKQFQEDIQGNFGGIGAEIGIRENKLTVIAPLKDTPAMKAGLLAGDWIVAINATSTDDLSISKAIKLIRGPIDSEVTLTIFREGWKDTKDFALRRALIEVPTLDFEMKNDVAYIALHSFNGNSNDRFYEAVRDALVIHRAKGMVFDLRDNPGGYLNVAVDLAGWFLPRGTLVVTEAGRDEDIKERFYANGNAVLAQLPIVILVNRGSASASEILAGALRDVRKVPLVGEKTFGKGTVQQIEELSDGSSIKVTVAHWVLPGGGAIDGEGIAPDYEVKITDDDSEQKRDPQLEKALAVLREML